LVVDDHLDAGGGPVHELNCSLALGGGHGRVYIPWGHVTAVQEAARHVLAVAGVALSHHGRGLKHHARDLGHGNLLVEGLRGAYEGRVGLEHEVDARVGHQVGLEFVKAYVEGAVEAERRGEGRRDLGDHSVEVDV